MNAHQRKQLSVGAEIQKAEDERRKMLKAFGNVFQRADRIITGSAIKVKVVRDPGGYVSGAPGWTDGISISLNEDILDEKFKAHGATDPDTILAIKGVNYHEVAHTLYSPRANSPLGQRVTNDLYTPGWRALNILEDMRAESMFQAVYPTAKHYFTIGVAQFILDQPDKVAQNWPLITGRKFLPRKMRDVVHQEWEARHGKIVPASEFTDIIDEYKTLVFPQEEMKAFPMVEAYMDLLIRVFGAEPDIPKPTSGGHTAPVGGMPEKGRLGKRRQDQAQDRLAEQDDDEDPYEDLLEESDDDLEGDGDGFFAGDDDYDDDQDDDGSGAGDGSADSSDDGQSESGDADQAGNEAKASEGKDSDDGVKDGVGIGKGDPDSTSDGNIGDAIETLSDLIDQVKDLDDLQDDIDMTSDAIKHELDDDHKTVGTRSKGYDRSVHPEMEVMSRKLKSIWRELRLDLEPRWIQDQPYGRLNVKRAMTAQFGDLDVFELWDEGEEEGASTEVVLLLDQSSSMHWVADGASQIMWALKRGLDDAEIRTTVLGYSDGWTVLYLPEDKAPRAEYKSFPTYGGTAPGQALRESVRILRQSDAKNKLMLSVTDGGWWTSTDVTVAMELLTKIGAYKVMFEYGGSYNSNLGFDESHVIRNLNDLIPAVQDLVSEIMRNVRITY